MYQSLSAFFTVIRLFKINY